MILPSLPFCNRSKPCNIRYTIQGSWILTLEKANLRLHQRSTLGRKLRFISGEVFVLCSDGKRSYGFPFIGLGRRAVLRFSRTSANWTIGCDDRQIQLTKPPPALSDWWETEAADSSQSRTNAATATATWGNEANPSGTNKQIATEGSQTPQRGAIGPSEPLS